MRERRGHGRARASLLRWTLAPTAAGLLLGVLWWLAAPGGILHGDGSDLTSWDERDLVFAALGAVAGGVTVTVLAAGRARSGLPDRGLAALAGSVAGSALAAGMGLALGRIVGSRGADAAVPGSDFGLQALSAAAVWPAVTALGVLALTTLWWRDPK
ncbi:hypothetical protein [Sinomonas halotolerans]|uniref:Uncharacterized protein n=1 Tax=Sinomonas halotolerans TaxID=1644133 RepID=A0ABU9X624_9MICC